MTPTISVIIGTYQRRSTLPTVLDPLLADPAAREVVVVVDGSTDGSIEYLLERSEGDERLRPILTPNQGREATRQRGLEEASGDIVLFLDDDVRADPGLVSGHLARHGALGHRGGHIVLGYMPTAVPPPPHEKDTFTTVLYAAEYENRCARFEASPGTVIDNMWGGNISLRRDDALLLGMHNAEYPNLYFEDRDWGLRARRAGMHAVFDRSLSGTHMHRRSASAFFRDAARQGAGQAYLHHLYPELGPLDLADFWAGLPAPLAPVVRAAAADSAHRVLHASLGASVDRLGGAGLFGAQLRAAKLLRRIEQHWGARQALAAIEAGTDIDLRGA